MKLRGKGFYIWDVRQCERGNPDRIAALASEAGLTHVIIKIADGAFPFNVDLETGIDHARPLIKKLQQNNISVWGWQYVYGSYPNQEAEIAIKRCTELGVEGFSIHAEHEYKGKNKASAASQYMNILRSNLGSLPLALSTYRFPSFHPGFPFTNFLSRCDFNMPKVYWIGSKNNAGAQLSRSVNEYRKIHPFKPIIPTGIAIEEKAWSPHESEVIEFMQVAQKLNLSSVNFWEWGRCRRDLPNFWSLIKDYNYKSSSPISNLPNQYILAMNSHDPEQVIKLYHPNAVLINSAQAVQGIPSIRNWIDTQIKSYSKGSFKLVNDDHNQDIHNFLWLVEDKTGNQFEGRHTIGLQDEKIQYHYAHVRPLPR